MDNKSIYRILKSGTPAQRKDLVLSLPPDPMRDIGISLLDSNRPGMTVVALGNAALSYCNGSNPKIGRELALALHRYAVEVYKSASEPRGTFANDIKQPCPCLYPWVEPSRFIAGCCGICR
jgi:hypothetical protein